MFVRRNECGLAPISRLPTGSYNTTAARFQIHGSGIRSARRRLHDYREKLLPAGNDTISEMNRIFAIIATTRETYEIRLFR